MKEETTEFICDKNKICEYSSICMGSKPHQWEEHECNYCPKDREAKCVQIKNK